MMKKILVIEDEMELLENLAFFLTLEDYEVYSASNGEVGIELAIEKNPNLIICDINMPGMDGYQVLKVIRENEATRTVPFIFLTAHSEKSFIRQGMDLGADDYVSKPYTDEEILSAVRTRLEKHKVINDIHQSKIEDLRKNIASTLPHELKTPLSVILAYSDLLAKNYSEFEPDEIKTIALAMNNAGKRLHRLFDNYIYYTELFEYKLPDNPSNELKSVHLYQDLKKIAEGIAVTYPKVGLFFGNIDCVGVDMLIVHTEKLLEELIENAFKFSTENSNVTISAESIGSQYCVTIHNIGVEFTQDQIKSIGGFMQFNRKYIEQQGIGLGLAIVKQILNLYKAEMKIESSNGETLIKVYLPLLN